MGVFEDWRLGYPCEAFAYCVFFYYGAVYGIQWAHSMAGLVSCPVSHLLVKSAVESAKRKLARPVRPKEPLSVHAVQAMAIFHSSDFSLAVLRFLFIFSEGFYGFFRIDKINSFFLHDIIVISKIPPVVYHQCCVLIG